jgi:hypothetical protein
MSQQKSSASATAGCGFCGVAFMAVPLPRLDGSSLYRVDSLATYNFVSQGG